MRDDPTESQTVTAPLPSTFVSHFEPGLPAFSAARDWPAAPAGVMVRLGVSDGVSALVGAEAGGGFRGAKMIAFGGGRMQTSTACQLSLMLRPRSIVARSTLGEADVTPVKILAGKDDQAREGQRSVHRCIQSGSRMCFNSCSVAYTPCNCSSLSAATMT
jgi:hypothetical protein